MFDSDFKAGEHLWHYRNKLYLVTCELNSLNVNE